MKPATPAWAVVAVLGLVFAMTAVLIAVLFVGLDERTSPIIVTSLSTLGLALTTLVSALRANAAAEKADVAATKADIAAVKADQLQETVTNGLAKDAHAGREHARNNAQAISELREELQERGLR